MCAACTPQLRDRSYGCEHIHSDVLYGRRLDGRCQWDSGFSSSQVRWSVGCCFSPEIMSMSSPRYLLAPSVSEKVNVTWAGQVSVILSLSDVLPDIFVHKTYGGPFASDGR